MHDFVQVLMYAHVHACKATLLVTWHFSSTKLQKFSGMLILITSEKLIERRLPHLAANRAVPPRLEEHAQNSNKNGEKH